MLQDNETSHLTPLEADFIGESLLTLRTPEARELRKTMKAKVLEWALQNVEPDFVTQYKDTDLGPGMIVARALSDSANRSADTETIDVTMDSDALLLVREAAVREIEAIQTASDTMVQADSRQSMRTENMQQMIIGHMVIDEIDHHFGRPR